MMNDNIYYLQLSFSFGCFYYWEGYLQPIYKSRTGLSVRRPPTAGDRCECWVLVAYFYMLLCSCSCFVRNSSLNCHIMLSWFTFGLRVPRLKVETLLLCCLWFHYSVTVAAPGGLFWAAAGSPAMCRRPRLYWLCGCNTRPQNINDLPIYSTSFSSVENAEGKIRMLKVKYKNAESKI